MPEYHSSAPAFALQPLLHWGPDLEGGWAYTCPWPCCWVQSTLKLAWHFDKPWCVWQFCLQPNVPSSHSVLPIAPSIPPLCLGSVFTLHPLKQHPHLGSKQGFMSQSQPKSFQCIIALTLPQFQLLGSHCHQPSLWMSAMWRDEGMKIDMCSGAIVFHPLGSSSRCGFRGQSSCSTGLRHRS